MDNRDDTPIFESDEVKLHHATRAKAERLQETLEAEYPLLSLHVVLGDDTDHETFTNLCGGFRVIHDEDRRIWEGEKVPELADILDACAELEIDPVGEESDEEEGQGGSIVKDKYRATYIEVSSNGQTCGDWLAERLVAETALPSGKLDMDALTQIFSNNDLNLNEKWALARLTETRGWQGRFRMSGRIVLEKKVAETGQYIDRNGNKVEGAEVADAIAELQLKHATHLAKLQKAKDKAAAATKA